MFDPFPTLKQHLRSLREDGEPEVHERVDLRAWTALGVGGTADLLVRCRSVGGVQRVLDLLAAHGKPWLVLGAGSRLVPPTEGLRVPVINLTGQLALWDLDLDGAVAGGGANLAQVSHAAARTGIPGLEHLMSFGNSVGGAVQALSCGWNTLDGLLDWVELVRPGAPVERVEWRYPSSGVEGSPPPLARRIVVRARLQLSRPSVGGSEMSSPARGRRLARKPRSTAPAFYSLGNDPVEDLLQSAGCVGMAVGGVRISKRTPNSISTSRSSRPEEIAKLVRMVVQLVAQRTGQEIESGLCFIDEDGRPLVP